MAIARRRDLAADWVAVQVIALEVEFVGVASLDARKDDLSVRQYRGIAPLIGATDRVFLPLGHRVGAERLGIKLRVAPNGRLLQQNKAAIGQCRKPRNSVNRSRHI